MRPDKRIVLTGLGLSIVHRIITEHGGTIRFESLPQRGTTVTLAFPCYVAPQMTQHATEAQKELPYRVASEWMEANRQA